MFFLCVNYNIPLIIIFTISQSQLVYLLRARYCWTKYEIRAVLWIVDTIRRKSSFLYLGWQRNFYYSTFEMCNVVFAVNEKDPVYFWLLYNCIANVTIHIYIVYQDLSFTFLLLILCFSEIQFYIFCKAITSQV